MTFHIEELRAGTWHRNSCNTVDVDTAIRIDYAEDRAGSALLFSDDLNRVSVGSGKVVACWTPGDGWVKLSGDPVKWWIQLPIELRKRLVSNPDMELQADDVLSVAAAGGSASMTYWVGSEHRGDFTLPSDLRCFVEAYAVMMRNFPNKFDEVSA